MRRLLYQASSYFSQLFIEPEDQPEEDAAVDHEEIILENENAVSVPQIVKEPRKQQSEKDSGELKDLEGAAPVFGEDGRPLSLIEAHLD